jgi:hypothetical protein
MIYQFRFREEPFGCLVNFCPAVCIYMTRGVPVGHDSSVRFPVGMEKYLTLRNYPLLHDP